MDDTFCRAFMALDSLVILADVLTWSWLIVRRWMRGEE